MRQKIGLILGPLAFATILMTPAPAGVPPLAWKTAAAGVLMAVWWITEAIPIPATALLPLALFPALGVATIDRAAAPYANPIIFLFLGGFILAIALENSGLHRRIAYRIMAVVGTRPRNLLFGFMLATALLSAAVSNTATVALMLPMGLSVIALVNARTEGAESEGFATALMLGLAYAATIGGLATLIGTPPNALLAGYLAESHGLRIGFAQWMLLGVPLAAVALPVCWAILLRLHRLPAGALAGGAAALRDQIRSLGPIERKERLAAAVTLFIALAWIFRPLLERRIPGLTDPGIAIAGAVLLFAIPVRWRRPEFVVRLGDLERVPWSVLLLFGGGLSLASAVEASGLALAIGRAVALLHGVPPWVAVVAVTTLVIFLTEMTSNTATAAAFLPIVGSAAAGIGTDPALLAVPTALAASCAFMLPVATPPNAIVYGSGRISVVQMVRAGIWLNLALIALITAATLLLARFVVE
ncbi:MAG TPA: DASS family sodium-coupled anion symporter [Thermoanaerobaculia bacterium]|nr:DASS family sodium-coupled anion symporter [Thermoanaerobaculia bacterium]